MTFHCGQKEIEQAMMYPKWVSVYQNLDKKRDDLPAETTVRQLAANPGALSVKAGDRIAVTVGSRFISNLVDITRAVVEFLKSKGAHPFLIPAMGSHGGATASGQLKVLHDFGFSEESMGVPVLSSMEVACLGEVDGIPIFFDRNALASDGIVVINRVKPHQFFKGDIQSGLNKMMALGLGKKKGADAIHGAGRIDILGRIGDFIRSKTPVIFGVAILENSYDETRQVAVVQPDEFKKIDSSWVKKSWDLLPRVPIRKLDMLIVAEMGKDISGSGMDTSIVGFTRRLGPSGQAAVPLAVFDLTDKSDGNAIGIGLADFTTRRLVQKIDFNKTSTNVIASGVYSAGRVPLTMATEREILEVILAKMGNPAQARMIKIKNTLQLENFYATEALQAEIDHNDKLTVVKQHLDTVFSEEGKLMLT